MFVWQDPAYQFGGASSVARAIMSYMSHFFSCRSCSTNFSRHVQSLGYLPRSGDAAVLWLWAAHNLANSLLDGDMTEDPTRPKIQWPDNINCPRYG